MILELFEPYLIFISFFVTIVVNVYLIVKRVNWLLLILGNLIIAIVMGFFGLAEYNIITQAVQYIGQVIKDIFSSISLF